jgi:hypothetical protein
MSTGNRCIVMVMSSNCSERESWSIFWYCIVSSRYAIYLVNDFHAFLYRICSAGDGIVVRGQAYGIRSIRVDGNDALAVYSAIHTAREMAISEQRPVLVEVRLNFLVGFSCQHLRHWSFLNFTAARIPLISPL